MVEECKMAQALIETWSDFSISQTQFQCITADFAEAMEEGISGRASSLQMLPGFVGHPRGDEIGTYLSLDFGGTNVRVAEIELLTNGKAVMKKMHKAPLKSAAGGYDHTSAAVHIEELFDYIACQLAVVADGSAKLLGHSFSYASKQTSLGQARLVGWTKEIKVGGVAGQDINTLLVAALVRQKLPYIRPVAVINDTTATLLTAAYFEPQADLGSVCATGHNTCYYEAEPRHGDRLQPMAYNAESGGFDRLPFSLIDDELDAGSEYPGRQRLEKMVAGRYLGELARRILWTGQGQCGMGFLETCDRFQKQDGLSSLDLSVFVGDETHDLDAISNWFSANIPGQSVSTGERYFIKAVAELVVKRAAILIAASYAGFLHRMDPLKRRKHLIGVNGSLYEKMPGFAREIQQALALLGGWNENQLRFSVVDEAPLFGAAIAAAMAERQEGGF